MAVSAGFVNNPLVLLCMIAVLWLVVVARQGNAPWARAFGLYVALAGFIVAFRLGMYVLVGVKMGKMLLLEFPRLYLPEWAAGIGILGPVYWEGVVQAGVDGLRLGTIIIAVGAANTLANPKQLVRSLPAALGEVGTAVVIALSLAPQFAESLVRVRRAQGLRGENATGLRGIPALLLPVLQDTLEGALKLAASMDSRGYGRRALLPPGQRRINTAVSFCGLVGVCVGLYLLLDATLPPLVNVGVLLVSCALVFVALRLQSKRSQVTRYFRPEWASAEWLTVGCGMLVAVAVFFTKSIHPSALLQPNFPLAPPEVPWLVIASLLVAALPAGLTPEPAPVARRGSPRRKVEMSA